MLQSTFVDVISKVAEDSDFFVLTKHQLTTLEWLLHGKTQTSH